MSAGVEGSERLGLRPRPMSRRAESKPEYATPKDDTPSAAAAEAHPRGLDAGSEPQPTADPSPEDDVTEPSSPDHPLLIDAHEDRWRWRRRIRENPRKLFFYRICVALLGALLLCLAAITGPLPGPGGIPIAILGIAVWSSEFEWAQRLMIWFKSLIKRYQALPRPHRVLLGCLAVLGALTGVYLALLNFGVPPWLPEFITNALRHLPGL